MLQSSSVTDWLHNAAELALSREFLQALVLQLAIVLAAFAVAWCARQASRGITAQLSSRIEHWFQRAWLTAPLTGLATPIYAWLLLLVAHRIGQRSGHELNLVGVAASLTALWVVLRASTALLKDALLARLVAGIAGLLAALDITGLLAPTAAALDSIALTVGAVRLSLLMVIKAALILAILLWIALGLARLIGARIHHLTGLSPSVQALTSNLLNIALVALALAIGLNAVGIDLTGLAVFGGAIGVGVGLGLQKVVSNFVSGIVLLVEESIKPGDVIEIGHTYGSVSSLGARYTSVRGRDGKEYLIPNENLITNQVVNWSYSSPLLRLDLNFGVGYASDLRLVRHLAIEAAGQTARVIASPAPVCHITEFADNGVNLLLRFWIEDPANGVKNVTGDVYLALWDALVAHGIELPYPQRDIHIRDLPPALKARVAPEELGSDLKAETGAG